MDPGLRRDDRVFFMTKDKVHLRWGCRRGMLELDLILLPFLDACFDSLSSEEQKNFALMLEEADQDLYAWILNVIPCPDEKYFPLLEKIRAFHAFD